ncbi:hypothetical protein D3C85_1121720 [compost metagenome]
MVWQDQRAGFGDLQTAGDIHAGGFQLVDFLEQRLRRQHHTVADEALDACTQNARRDQAQHGLFAIHNQSMTSVVTTLEADNTASMVCQPVNNLALALVTPLGADYDDILGHW